MSLSQFGILLGTWFNLMKNFKIILSFFVFCPFIKISAGLVEAAQFKRLKKKVSCYADHHHTDKLLRKPEDTPEKWLAHDFYIDGIVTPRLDGHHAGEDVLLLVEDSDALQEDQFLFHLSQEAREHRKHFDFIEYKSVDVRNGLFTHKQRSLRAFLQEPIVMLQAMQRATADPILMEILSRLEIDVHDHCEFLCNTLRANGFSNKELTKTPLCNLLRKRTQHPRYKELSDFIDLSNEDFVIYYNSIIEATTLWLIATTKKSNIVAVLGYNHIHELEKHLKELGYECVRETPQEKDDQEEVHLISPETFTWIFDS